jgi:hypothetical protein
MKQAYTNPAAAEDEATQRCGWSADRNAKMSRPVALSLGV